MIEDNVASRLPVVLTRVIIPLLEQVSEDGLVYCIGGIPSTKLIEISLKTDRLLIE